MPVPVRFWSNQVSNIRYCVASETFATYHDERLAADGATSRGIPPRTKLESYDEHEILPVSGQSDIEIYILGSLLKYMPSTMTIARPWMELQAGEFPQMRNWKRTTNTTHSMFLVKVMLKYTSLGRL